MSTTTQRIRDKSFANSNPLLCPTTGNNNYPNNSSCNRKLIVRKRESLSTATHPSLHLVARILFDSSSSDCLLYLSILVDWLIIILMDKSVAVFQFQAI